MSQNHIKQQAKTLYLQIIEGVRQPILYTKGNVEDTFNGRFRLMHLFLGILLYGIDDNKLARLVLEESITDLDGNYREMGVGDMKFSKLMKKSNALMCLNVRVYKNLSLKLPNTKLNKDLWEKAFKEHLFSNSNIINSICLNSWFVQITYWIKYIDEIQFNNEYYQVDALPRMFKADSKIWFAKKL